MGVYWLAFLGVVVAGFGVAEGYALANRVPGDTLSERVRVWLRTDTPGGGWTFAGVWVALAVVWAWFLGHILECGPR